MSNIRRLIVPLCAFATLVTAQTPPRTENLHFGGLKRVDSRLFYYAPPSSARMVTRRAASGPPALAANVTPATCPEPQAVCGYVAVPLDRSNLGGQKIQIYFEQYSHTNPGPAESAILANFGGPGSPTTDVRDFAQYLFGANLDVHDLVLIDDRGRGLSGAIDCKPLQHDSGAFGPLEAACAAQLGFAASLYGSGDVAMDTDAVRAALGYDQVDYFGASYGGVDVTAYATRFGEHLRSVILDAPNGEPNLNEFARLAFRTHSDPRMVRLVCARSRNCAPDHPNADADFQDLIQSIQDRPVEGDTHDASGNPMHVRVDEDALLNFVVTYPDGIFTNTGEILAAASALKQGDSAPLLRLAAEQYSTLTGDSGDPTSFSAGGYYAPGCADAGQPWDWSDSVADRKAQYNNAVWKLPSNYFAPFSRFAPTGLFFSTLGKQCLWWQLPTVPSPVVPDHASYPHVPTLVLGGDLDNRVPMEVGVKVAALFPDSTFVRVAGAGHYTIGFSSCARGLVSSFLESLHVGDTSCANTPKIFWPAVGRFPLFAKDARPAALDPHGVNQIGIADRKVVTVSVAALTDALQRSNLGSGVGVGLRGGTFQTTFGSTWVSTLTNCAFASDVLVSGIVRWRIDNSVGAELSIGGSGTAGGKLHVTGFFFGPSPVGNLKVTGWLGGKRVAVLVPAG